MPYRNNRRRDTSRSQISAALCCLVAKAGDVDDIVDGLVGRTQCRKEASQRRHFFGFAVPHGAPNPREGL